MHLGVIAIFAKCEEKKMKKKSLQNLLTNISRAAEGILL